MVSMISADNQNIYVIDNELSFTRDGTEYMSKSDVKKYDLNGKFISNWYMKNTVSMIK
jgi:hypothetical protein